MFKDKNLKAYDKDYYNRQVHMRNEYTVIAKWVASNIPGEVYGDVGCGEGHLIADLDRHHNKQTWGVDGSPAFREFVDPAVVDNVSWIDLTRKNKLKPADVAVSMEVGEHLPEKSADRFVDTIVSTGAKTILFTAAQPGQGGTNHINLQPTSYWIEKFENRGYKTNAKMTQKFKKDLEPKLKHAWWYVKNVTIFDKRA